MSTGTVTKLNAKSILAEMDGVLTRFRAGLLSLPEARQELSILTAMQKAFEATILEERIALLEAVLEGRNGR